MNVEERVKELIETLTAEPNWHDEKSFKTYQNRINQILSFTGEAVPTLIEILQTTDNFDTGRFATMLLGKLNDFRAEEILLTILHAQKQPYWPASIGALSDLKSSKAVEPLCNILIERKYKAEIRIEAAEALGEIKDNSAIPALTKVYLDITDIDIGYHDHYVREAVTYSLSKFDSDVFVLFLDTLISSDLNTRQFAALGLGMLRDERAVESLMTLTDEPDKFTRFRVIQALVKIENKCAFDILIQALCDNYHPIRSIACKGLGKLKDERAFEPLMKRLTDVTIIVRASAIEGLGDLGDQRAIPSLIEVLTSQEYRIRSAAVIALGKLGNEQTIPILTKALRAESNDNWYNRKIKHDISRAIKAIQERINPALHN